MERLDSFAAVIQEDHENILADWRKRVRSLPRSRSLDRLTLEDGFRSFLDEITNALLYFHDTGELRKDENSAAVEHGRQRFDIGVDITQLVIEYGMLRHALQACAARHNISLDGMAGHVLHEIIDDAITSAVATYVTAQTAQHEARVQERVAMVVHDLKTPLSSIHSASHLLEGRLSPESKKSVSTMLGVIIRNCDSLNSMLMKLLESASRNEIALHAGLNSGDVHLCSLVADVIESIRPLAQRASLTVVNDVPDGQRVNADPFLLKQALQNLLSNALKYTEKGRIVVGAAEAAHRVSVWVEDTGVGMPPDKIAKLFMSGERDPARPESSGMGLSIVKKIVDAHNGDIHVESEVGKGSTFTLTLPR